MHLACDAVHHGKSQQVRQVAHGCEGGVVRLGRHAGNAAAQRCPQVLGLLQLRGEGALGGCQDDLAPAVEIGFGVLHARHFAAGDGVSRHERAHLVTQGPAGRLHHVGLGRSHVHDQHLRRDQVLDGFECGLGSRHRHGYQHDVGAGNGQQGGGRFHIDHAQLAGAVGGGGRLAVAHDTLDQARLLHGQCKRAAHEPAADQSQLFEHGGSLRRHGVGPEHLVESAQAAQFFQGFRHMGLSGVAVEVDVEVVLPLAGAGRA